MGENNAFSVFGSAMRDVLSNPAFSDMFLIMFTLGISFCLISTAIRFFKNLCYGGHRRPVATVSESHVSDTENLCTVERVKCNIHGGICDGCPLSGTSSCYGVIVMQERMHNHGKS